MDFRQLGMRPLMDDKSSARAWNRLRDRVSEGDENSSTNASRDLVRCDVM